MSSWLGSLGVALALTAAVAAPASAAGTTPAIAPEPAAPASGAGPASWEGDLSPIALEDWSYDRAAHLLERAGFGGTPAEIRALAAMPPREAVRHLVRYQEVARGELPVFEPSGIFPDESFAPPLDGEAGKHMFRAAIFGGALGVDIDRERGKPWLQPVLDQVLYLLIANSIEATRVARWQGERMLLTRRPLEEKLALFWHGHFATENDKVRDYRKMMAQWDLYRRLGNGGFRDLLLAVARDPAMLIYLDGVRNVRGHPNENFARELLELFSLGVGSYTEADIQEAARAFTGWGLDGNEFDAGFWSHDRGRKTFLGHTGRFDGEDVIDLIVAEPACARFVAGKLYRFFVREDLAPEHHERIAAALRESDLEIAALLETLLLSRDFYSPASYATRIKSPVHLVVSTYRKLELDEVPGAPNFHQVTKALGQALYDPPNVAGWAGGRAWINPSTLTDRQNFARYLLFPREIPLPERRPLDFVADLIGRQPYEQLRAMARRGDFMSPPRMSMEDSGFARADLPSSELANPFRAIYNGARKALRSVRFDDPLPIPFSVAELLRGAGVSDAAGAVDHLLRRFLRAPLQPDARAELVRFLEGRTGAELDYERRELEGDLRELLHLILSVPEYQLA